MSFLIQEGIHKRFAIDTCACNTLGRKVTGLEEAPDLIDIPGHNVGACGFCTNTSGNRHQSLSRRRREVGAG
eukprot:765069-Hanusia_phi.AAC.2